MQTKTSARWQATPGSFDALHTDHLFPAGDNPYGIPSIPHAPLSYAPNWLAPYRTRIRAKNGTSAGAVHFFLDDYRFETTWSRPAKALQYLRDFETLLTPDFSLYPNWPLATQIWNVYRSRWCGAYWASIGFRVIPTISWSGRESYGFSFAGVARRSIVAVSTVGVHRSDLSHFEHGYCEMIQRIEPSRVLCYGKLPSDLESLADIRQYPTRWEGVKSAAGCDDGR